MLPDGAPKISPKAIPDEQRVLGRRAKVQPEDDQDDQRHADEQHAVAAEHPERAVIVLREVPAQEMRHDHHDVRAVVRVRDHQAFGELVEPERRDGDRATKSSLNRWLRNN